MCYVRACVISHVDTTVVLPRGTVSMIGRCQWWHAQLCVLPYWSCECHYLIIQGGILSHLNLCYFA
jgi:hypothetical protein